MAGMKIIAGLGNPGREYAGTRHNAGFEAVDRLAEMLGVEVRRSRFNSFTGQGLLQDVSVMLIKPQTFMNRSGLAVADAMSFFKLGPQDLMVATDDMALEPGQIRIRPKGSAGGHNGLADIIERLGTDGFARLRIGIGAADMPDWADYVLARPGPEQRQRIVSAVEKAAEAMMCWLSDGLPAAMNRYNGSADGGENG